MAIVGNQWKTDNYKFVKKTFEYEYKTRINKLLPILGEVETNSIDYAIEGAGGYGEMEHYDGTNLNKGEMKRGFSTIVVPEEYSKTATIRFKQAKVDKSGECRKTGTRLANAALATVFVHALRLLGGAFDSTHVGGDGKPWAATDHPVASKGSEGRKFIVDPDSGTFSNLINQTLSVSGISAAQELASRYICPDGLPFLCDMDTLLVSPELEPVAKKICGENSRLYPGQVNDVNPYTGLKYIVIGGGRDGFSEKQWALCDKRIMKEVFNIVYITRPRVLNSQLDNPLIDEYTGYADFGLGWGDARQIVFSNPN
ncbi:MAG: hypothetical protein Q4A04_08470 [Eubacteriales bacterium]|nr:hypothetical protein [Eubacteriales bacterium]